MFKNEFNTFFSPDERSMFKYLYARKDGVGKKDVGQKLLNSWQAWNAVTSEEEFLLPELYTFRASDQLLFSNWHIEINGDIYRKAVIYSQDKELSPDGNPVELVLKNPKKEDFSETPVDRGYDLVHPLLVETLNKGLQIFINLAVAIDAVISRIDKITPVRNVSLETVRTGIHNNRAEILNALSVDVVNDLWYVLDRFLVADSMWSDSLFPGIHNIEREFPEESLPYVNSFISYRSYLGPHIPEYAWGVYDFKYSGPVRSFSYSNPGVFSTNRWDWITNYSKVLDESEQLLNELGINLNQYINNPVVNLDKPEGYLEPDDPYWKDPIDPPVIPYTPIMPETPVIFTPVKQSKTNIPAAEKEKPALPQTINTGTKTESSTGSKLAVAFSVLAILKLIFK